MSEPAPGGRRRVRRGEGEVTQWPRGVTSYVPAGPAESTPDPSEDRLQNRLLLAVRLVGVMRARGEPTDPLEAKLRSASAALRAGDRAAAGTLVDAVLASLDARAAGTAGDPPGRAQS